MPDYIKARNSLVSVLNFLQQNRQQGSTTVLLRGMASVSQDLRPETKIVVRDVNQAEWLRRFMEDNVGAFEFMNSQIVTLADIENGNGSRGDLGPVVFDNHAIGAILETAVSIMDGMQAELNEANRKLRAVKLAIQ